MDQLSKAVSWFSFRVELHRTCGLVSRETWLPSRWISFCVFVCVCLEVKGFGSEVSEWGQPAALRQQRPALRWYKKTKQPTEPFPCPPLRALAFLPARICWSCLYKVYHFIQTFRVRVRTYEYLPYSFWVKSKIGWHLFSRSGWAAIQVDGWWKCHEQLIWKQGLSKHSWLTTLRPFLAPNK